MKEENNIIIVIGVIILALAFYQYGQSFSIFSTGFDFEEDTLLYNHEAYAKSNQPFGENVTSLDATGNNVIHTLTEKNLIDNGILIVGQEHNTDGPEGGTILPHKATTTVIITKALNLNKETLDELTINFKRRGTWTSSTSSTGGHSGIYLSNENGDVELYSGIYTNVGGSNANPSVDESHFIKLEEMNDNLFLTLDTQTTILDIGNESFELVILSQTNGHPQSGNTASVTEEIEITSLSMSFKQVNETIEVYRLTNNSCSKSTILQNERLTTDYDALNACELNIESPEAPTCSDGIQNQEETGIDCGGSCNACPVGDRCYAYLTSTCQETQCNLNYTYYDTLDDCIEEYEGESFLDKYGIPGSVVLIIIITIGIWIIIKKK